MNSVMSLGKYLYAIPFILFGVFHFMKGPEMAGLLDGWPMALPLTYISGLALILAGVSIIIGKMTRTACLLLALLLLIFILTIHLKGLGNEATAQYSMIGMLKDLSLMGGALIIAQNSTD